MKFSPKCTCPACTDNKGNAYTLVMIEQADGPPITVGSIEIQFDPLVIDMKMVDKISMKAARELSKLVTDKKPEGAMN